MCLYRLRDLKKGRDLSEFDPIDWYNLCDIDDSIHAMLKKFEIEVTRAMYRNQIEFPTPIKSVHTSLAKWSGWQSDDLIAKLGKMAFGRGYEACIEIDVDYEENNIEAYYQTEDKIADMIANSTFFQEMMKSYECIIVVEFKRHFELPDPKTGIDG